MEFIQANERDADTMHSTLGIYERRSQRFTLVGSPFDGKRNLHRPLCKSFDSPHCGETLKKSLGSQMKRSYEFTFSMDFYSTKGFRLFWEDRSESR